MNTKTACFMSILLVDPIKIYITSIAIVLGLFSRKHTHTQSMCVLLRSSEREGRKAMLCSVDIAHVSFVIHFVPQYTRATVVLSAVLQNINCFEICVFVRSLARASECVCPAKYEICCHSQSLDIHSVIYQPSGYFFRVLV